MNYNNTSKKTKSQPKSKQTEGKIVLFWKMPGETLAIMLRRFMEEQNLDADTKLTYAGRLDPMAEGIVPILVGEARFQKDMLLGRAKTYEVAILLGIGTDTGDMLGFALPAIAISEGGSTASGARSDLANITLPQIKTALKTVKETVSLPYPNYSSRPVDGKPLFMHARAGNEVVLPIKKVTIYELELLSIQDHPAEQLIDNAIEIIKKVQGDFRQDEIIKQWQEKTATWSLNKENFKIVTIRTKVSSGTYMRALAEKLGKLLKVPALAYRIVRTEVDGIKEQ